MISKRTKWAALAMLSLAVVASGMGRKEKKTNAEIVTGIKGKVEIFEGNFMPMTDPNSGRGKVFPGAGRRVRLHEKLIVSGPAKTSHDSIPTPLVAEVVCDSNGAFAIAAAPGKYSIFVEENGGWYYNGFDSEGVQGGITVEKNKITETTIKITTKATF